MPAILIVDDDPAVRMLLVDILVDFYECLTADSGPQALELLPVHLPAVVISDINMPGMSGLELIPRVRALSPDTVVMMISGNQAIDNAIEAMQQGAFDFIKKPFELDHVEFAVRRAVEHHELLISKRSHEQELESLVKSRTEQLEYLAYYDETTGLPNRARLEDDLARALAEARDGQSVAAMIVSSDRFRAVRDTLGRASADQLLKEFGARLRASLGAENTVARFDGHEFAVLMPSLSDVGVIHSAIKAITDSLGPPLTAGARELFLTASIGVSVYPADGSDSNTLLTNAGAALSRAKDRPERYAFYDEAMQQAAIRRLGLEDELHNAAGKGEMLAYYQPLVANATGRIVGAEALLRWQHGSTLIQPVDFIPIAEETGIIVELGEWVLREACSATRRWLDSGHDLRIAVNVAAAQFDANLGDVVRRALSDTDLDPRHLDLEVTESSIMSDPLLAAELLGDLRSTGITVSIDDFGTGYSSLGHLKQLPIDFLKIDKSFVTDINRNPDDASLIMGIIGLAHNLSLKVVAEGVETTEQLRFLDVLRCDEWQGYLCSKPRPGDEFEKILSSGARFRFDGSQPPL